jgi:RimJ/RimL family protein N-acetyltransferase
MKTIYLKHWQLSDITFYNKIRNNKDNSKSLMWPSWSYETKEETLKYIKSRSKKSSLFTIWLNNERVGYIQLLPLTSVGSDYYGISDVGIFIDQNARGNGYGKRALELIENETPYSVGLTAKIESSNKASLNLFLSLNYEVIGEVPIQNIPELKDCLMIYLLKRI